MSEDDDLAAGVLSVFPEGKITRVALGTLIGQWKEEGARSVVPKLAALLCPSCAGLDTDPEEPHSVHQEPERFTLRPIEIQKDEEVWRHRYYGGSHGKLCQAARLWQWAEDPTYDPFRALRGVL